MVNNFKTFILY